MKLWVLTVYCFVVLFLLICSGIRSPPFDRSRVWLCRARSKQKLFSLCFKPSQPQQIISGLKKTFTKIYIYSWKDQWDRMWETGRMEWESGELSGEFKEWNTVSWKGHKDGNRHTNRIKRNGQARLVYVKNINRSISTPWRWAHGDLYAVGTYNLFPRI